MFTAVVEGVEELAHDWERATTQVRYGALRGVYEGCTDGASEARENHSFQNQSGDLEKSIQGRLTSADPNDPRGEIVAKEKYASFVDQGTAAHIIRAKLGRGQRGPKAPGQSRGGKGDGLLHFQIGGRWISKAEVHHPGTKPMPFMALAYFKCERVMIRCIEVGIASAQEILDR
jgi:hypothetical protein